MVLFSTARPALIASSLSIGNHLQSIMPPTWNIFSNQKPQICVDDFPLLLDLNIDKASHALAAGHFSSELLVAAYIKRIEEASEFRAVLQINPDVLSDARDLDEERIRSGSRGKLHGIPILVKDNIVTSDNLDASAGSFTFLGAKPAAESSLITRLRRAGALILGKTNLSEWSNFRGLNITAGWSPRGGQTIGAYYAKAYPEGSSSGSAVATALGLCIASLGTETVGSITDPAELNNVVGFKPTRGLVATDSVIPISKRQDVVGTLTVTVRDAAHLLTIMAGRSEKDDRTWEIPPDLSYDFTSFCEGTNLKHITIGIPRNTFGDDVPAPILTSFESALDTLRSAKARIIDNANFKGAEEFKRLNAKVKGVVRSSEYNRDMNAYVATLESNPNNIKSVGDIIAFTKSDPREEYPKRDIGKFLWTQEKGIDVNSAKYKEMVNQELYFGGEGGILGAMQEHQLDVLAVPSTSGIAIDLAAKMGFPVITVPLGFWPEGTSVQEKDGLVKRAPGIPYCLTLITRAYSDEKLFQVAYAFEQLGKVRSKGPRPFKTPATELKDVQQNSTNS